MITWNGGIGFDQMTWLKNILTKSTPAGEKVGLQEVEMKHDKTAV